MVNIMTKQQLPSDTLRKPTRRTPWILSGIAAAALVVSAVTVGPSIAANLTPSAAPSPTMTPYVAALTPAELDSVQQGADAQQAIIVADQAAAAKAAADAAAAQAAASAAKATHHAATATGPIRCPAGSTANSGDGGNDTSCFPDICFHVTLPDPAYPQCVTAFKP